MEMKKKQLLSNLIYCSWLALSTDFLWTGWICLIHNLVIHFIFIFYSQVTYCLQIATSLLWHTSARLDVHATGADHHYLSFQNVTEKWQEHADMVA